MHEESTAVIICRHRTRGYLFESMLGGRFDRVIHVRGPREAIDLVMRGTEPQVVLLDVDLYGRPADTGAAAATLRIIANEAVVLEVGEHLDTGMDPLVERFLIDTGRDRAPRHA